jgi:hypothetical protein
MSKVLHAITLALMFSAVLSAQEQLFDHPDDSRIWLSGQINIIHQQHPSFFAKYSGENSLRPEREKATSQVYSFYTGYRLSHSSDILFDVESAGGRGISDALGLAGFTNLDVVRNPELGSKPYLARLLFHQMIRLGGDIVRTDRNFLSLMPEKPEKRIEIYAGKLSLADFFDNNSVGSDSHTQFMNWVIDNDGAYDYAADTRGYTYGALVDLEQPRWAIRFAEALMPKVANGINLEWNLHRARAENLEFQVQPRAWHGHQTVVRLLSYINHANMGNYREAIDAFLAGEEPTPDIEAHRPLTRKKYGFGFNGEQDVTGDLHVYTRVGWNEGHNESFAYTEVNSAASVGASIQGVRWRRNNDKGGFALAVNGISGDHRRYLQLGGNGFLLGDGNLTYGHEEIVESYYTARLIRGIFASVDLQHINHPGYNRDRGPVFVPSLRLHLEF